MKSLRRSLNSDIEILDLPAPYVGKYMDVKRSITNTLSGLVSILYVYVYVMYKHYCL